MTRSTLTINSFRLIFLVLLVTGCNLRSRDADAGNMHFTCPMHPQIVTNHPGDCPICGMKLVPLGTTKHENRVTLNKTQRDLAAISTKIIKQGSIFTEVIAPARVVINEERSASISARAAGRIEKLYAREAGQKITAGDPLYDLYSEQLLSYEIEYRMAADNAIKGTDATLGGLRAAAAEKLLRFGLTTSQLDALTNGETPGPRITFFAPVGGIVSSVEATEGQYVGEGELLLRIGNVEQVWVEVRLFPGDLEMVKIGSEAKVIIDAAETSALVGSVIFISPAYAKNDQALMARISVDNTSGQVRPGSQATVSIRSSPRTCLVVPAGAVIHAEKGAHVWIQDRYGSFYPQRIMTGTENVDGVEVTSGLKPGVRIVASGAFLLDAEMILKNGGKVALLDK